LEIKDMADFKKKVKVVFVSYGSRENGATGRTNVADMKTAASTPSSTNPR
jgi:hypothetical protein